MKIPIFPGKHHQIGGFSMAMLVYRSVGVAEQNTHTHTHPTGFHSQSLNLSSPSICFGSWPDTLQHHNGWAPCHGKRLTKKHGEKARHASYEMDNTRTSIIMSS